MKFENIKDVKLYIKDLEKELEEVVNELSIANRTILEQMKEIQSLLSECNKIEEHIRICEREHERKDIILNYLEVRLIELISES